MGVRASYKVNDKLALNYWIVNGTNQTEPTNSYKDELFGFTAQPTKNISWNMNYYIGQDHPDVTAGDELHCAAAAGALCLQPINPAPDGKATYLRQLCDVERDAEADVCRRRATM